MYNYEPKVYFNLMSKLISFICEDKTFIILPFVSNFNMDIETVKGLL